MDETQIEVNRDFKSIAASWLGIEEDDLNVANDNEADNDLNNSQENISYPKTKIKLSLKEKIGDTQTCFSEYSKKTKNGNLSTALFVSGKLKRKLQKAKTRSNEDKNEDEHRSSVEQGKFFNEDSKAAIIQNKSNSLNKAQVWTDSLNSVEDIRRLLAVTKDKKHRRKLHRKLKRLLSKSCKSNSDESESKQLPSHLIETDSKDDSRGEKSTQLLQQAISNKSKTKKKNINKTSGTKEEILSVKSVNKSCITSDTISKQDVVTKVSKKVKRKKNKTDTSNEKCVASMDVHSADGQTSHKNYGNKNFITSDTSSKQDHAENVSKKVKRKKKKIGSEKCVVSMDVGSPDETLSYKDHGKKSETGSLSGKTSFYTQDDTGKKSKRKKKKRNDKCTESDMVSDIQSRKTKDKNENHVKHKKAKIVCESGKKESVNSVTSEISDKKNAEVKRKRTVCDDLNEFSHGKLKKQKVESSQNSQLPVPVFNAESIDKSSEEETSKQPETIKRKRKRKKKRSKQKNIRKDHRPDHLKPPHLRAKASGASIV